MYKVTQLGSFEAVYDSAENLLPEGAVYFHTHQLLWKDDILLGRVFIDDNLVTLRIDNNPPITFDRKSFQELFERDVHIVELLFHSNEIRRVDLKLKKQTKRKQNHCYATRLYRLKETGDEFYGELFYWI